MNNYAQSTSYKIFLPFLGDEFTYVQNISLPGLNLSPPQANLGGKTIYTGGDHIDYDPITVSFIIDEQMNLYKKLLKYILKRIHQNDGTIDPLKEFTCGVEITDSKGVSILCLMYYGCKITNLGDIQLISNAEDTEQILSLTFNFDDFELIDYFGEKELSKLKQNIIKS